MNPILNEPISAKIIALLYKQELFLKNNPVDGITFYLNENDILDIQADIEGPVDTPYENGVFRVQIKISSNFPNVAPKCFFLTRIFHPNISEQGEICVNTLNKDWNPKKWSLKNLFQIIKCLLIIPFPQSALNEEAGKLFMEDYNQYFKIAQMYTNIHAKTKNINENINEENNSMNIEKDEEKEYDEDEKYKTPIKEKKINIIDGDDNMNNYYEEKNIVRNSICNKIINDNYFNYNCGKLIYSEDVSGKNYKKLDMYSISEVKRNISVSDSKNKKEEIEKWISRI